MNCAPRFLTFDHVLLLHTLQAKEFGGAHGLKDEGLLRSAIAQPQSGFGKVPFHKNLYEMAAAYLFHIVRNHPFIDGNKRTGALVAAVFLEINGLLLTASNDDFEEVVMNTAKGLLSKAQIAEFFRAHTKKPRMAVAKKKSKS